MLSSPESTPRDKGHRARSTAWLAAFVVTIAALMVRQWAQAANRSLWLDETATHYLVSGTWSELFDRLSLHPHMSPGYYVVLKALGSLGLPMEMGLRWQSLAAVAAASVLLFRLGARLFERTSTAVFAAAIFVVSPDVAYHACSARPYALALLCVTASALLLFRWLDSGRRLDAAGFILATVAMIWVHYTTALMMLPYTAYALERRHTTRVGARHMAWAAACVAALTGPLALGMLESWRSAELLSFAPVPSFHSLVMTLALPVVAGVAPVVLAAAARHRGKEDPVWRATRFAPGVVWLWLLLPPVLTFAAAIATPAKLFVGRYFVSMFGATALLLAALVQTLPRTLVRNGVLFAIIALSVRATPESEDWRGAVLAVRHLALGSETPILLISGYVEALDPTYLDDPRYRAYLSSPLFSYPVTGRTILLPDRTGHRVQGRVEGLTEPELVSARQIVVLSGAGAEVADWVRERALHRGFSARSLGEFPRVTAVLLERRATK